MPSDSSDLAMAKLSALTAAEQAVLDQALTGAPAREIADRLSLSEATVRSHLSRIYLKLGVSGRVALLASFRESDAAGMPGRALGSGSPEIAIERPLAVRVIGVAWTGLAVLEAAYSLYLGTWVLAYGAAQATWLELITFTALAALTALVGRRLMAQPTAANMLRSLALATAYLLFGALGVVGGGSPLPERLSLIVATIGFALAWLSFRAWRELRGRAPVT
jgi:DNA-binding CsgD family transcriptional regulator